jgi:hypothetical protein
MHLPGTMAARPSRTKILSRKAFAMQWESSGAVPLLDKEGAGLVNLSATTPTPPQ